MSEYRAKYKRLKAKLKHLVYEQECFVDEMRKTQRKLVRVSRDKSFLLDRLVKYETVPPSSSDDEATASSSSSDDGHSAIKIAHQKARKRPNEDSSGAPPAKVAAVGESTFAESTVARNVPSEELLPTPPLKASNGPERGMNSSTPTKMMMPFGGSSSGAKNPMLQSEEQVLRNAHHDAQCDISATSSGSSDSGSSSGASSGSNSPTTHHEDDNGLSVRHSSSSGDGGNAIALSTSKAPIRHRSTLHGSSAAPGRPQSPSLSTQGGVLAQQQQRASSNKVYHTPHQSMKQSHPAIPASNTIHLATGPSAALSHGANIVSSSNLPAPSAGASQCKYMLDETTQCTESVNMKSKSPFCTHHRSIIRKKGQAQQRQSYPSTSRLPRMDNSGASHHGNSLSSHHPLHPSLLPSGGVPSSYSTG